MPTTTVRMNEQDTELVRTFATFAAQELREAIAQDSGERFSIDDLAR